MARHVLTVWNPEIQPDAIERHVELLQRADDARVWWGRLYLGDPAKRHTARVSIAPLPELDALAQDGRLVLFVTDFSSLHALLIDRVTEQPDDEESVPKYVRGRPLLHAFRASDLRVISHDRLLTLTWMRENLGIARLEGRALDPARYRFDPYKSLNWAWPVEVEGPEVESLFPQTSHDAGRWVDRPETLHPPRLAAAIHRLSKTHEREWPLLEPESRIHLATAEVIRCETREAGFDPSPTVIGLARVLERELRDQIFVPLVRAARSGHHAAPPLARDYAPLNRELGETPERLLTLGAMPIVAGRLRAWLETDTSLAAVCAPALTAWLEQFAATRNDASHGRLVDRTRCQSLIATVLDGGAPHVLRSVTTAKRAVQRLLAG